MGVRRRALGALAVVAFVCLSPLAWPADRDSFPLTPYPMFAEPRPDADAVLVVALGVDATGEAPMPTEATGHGQLTQAVAALSSAVADGGDRPQRLCQELAAWVSTSDLDDVWAVRIVTAAYDGLAYLVRDDTAPAVLAEHAWCEVAR